MYSCDGIYLLYITGQGGNALAMLLLQDGVVTGADSAGSLFDGVYTQRGSIVKIDMQVGIKPQTTLAQGEQSGIQGMLYNINTEIDLSELKTRFTRVETTQGPLNVRIELLRGLNKNRKL